MGVRYGCGRRPCEAVCIEGRRAPAPAQRHCAIAAQHSGAPFVRYTMPALELRRFLTQLRSAGEAFKLTYTRLDQASDAKSRAGSAGGTTVAVSEDGKGKRSCTVKRGGLLGGLGGAPCGCGPDELAMLPPPSAVARKLILFEPYPIVEGDEEEVHCFGP